MALIPTYLKRKNVRNTVGFTSVAYLIVPKDLAVDEETRKIVHLRVDNTMSSKLFIMNSAFASFIIQISRSLCRQRVGVYVNKPLNSNH